MQTKHNFIFHFLQVNLESLIMHCTVLIPEKKTTVGPSSALVSMCRLRAGLIQIGSNII